MTANRHQTRLRFYLLLLGVTLVLGTLGFMLAEQRSFEDALYFTIVTIATVGYGDIAPVTPLGKLLAMLLIVLGVGTFLGVVASETELFLNRREEASRRQKMHMLIGLFYTEIGNGLLSRFVAADAGSADLAAAVQSGEEWQAADFERLQVRFQNHPFQVQIERLDLPDLQTYLQAHGSLLIRLLENPYTLEHETVTDLLLSVLHLREELHQRPELARLPENDLHHLGVDVSRAYGLISRQWVAYARHLQQHYPFLFSLARRTNPFLPASSAIIN